MTTAPLNIDQMVRLCRAKQNQLEVQVLADFQEGGMKRLDLVVADIALLFGLLADHLEGFSQDPR